MNELLSSRVGREEATKLENLSPEKYGKGAFAGMGYTPSRLAENVLFREVTTQKKGEEGQRRLREGEAVNSMLKDRLKQLEEERNGIENTLGQQIAMYKRMLHDNEMQHESRLKDLQLTFTEQMQEMLIAKEEEAKYSQAEKELLENRINELEHIIAELKADIGQSDSLFNDLTNEHQKLQIHLTHVKETLHQTELKAAADLLKENQKHEELVHRSHQIEQDLKQRLEQLSIEKNKDKESAKKAHEEALTKAEKQRCRDLQEKSEEFKEVVNKFEAETIRLNGTIESKERQIDSLNAELSEEKNRLNSTQRQYEIEITSLNHELGQCRKELESIWALKIELEQAMKAGEARNAMETNNLEAYVERLRKEIDKIQTASVYEQNRNIKENEDLQRQLHQQRIGREDYAAIKGENTVLTKEIKTLKELLVESSMEMETCKEEFLRIGREKEHLICRLNEMVGQNEILHRLKLEKEEEAKGWRDTYYQRR